MMNNSNRLNNDNQLDNQIELYQRDNTYNDKPLIGMSRLQYTDDAAGTIFKCALGSSSTLPIIPTSSGTSLAYDFNMSYPLTPVTGLQTIITTDHTRVNGPILIYFKNTTTGLLSLGTYIPYSEYNKITQNNIMDYYNINSFNMRFLNTNKNNLNKSGACFAGVFNQPFNPATVDCLTNPQFPVNPASMNQDLTADDDFVVSVPVLHINQYPMQSTLWDVSKFFIDCTYQYQLNSVSSFAIPLADLAQWSTKLSPAGRVRLTIHTNPTLFCTPIFTLNNFTLPAGFSVQPIETNNGILYSGGSIVFKHRWDIASINLTFTGSVTGVLYVELLDTEVDGTCVPYSFVCLNTTNTDYSLECRSHVSFSPSSTQYVLSNLPRNVPMSGTYDQSILLALEFLKSTNFPLVFSDRKIQKNAIMFMDQVQLSDFRAGLGDTLASWVKPISKWIWNNREALGQIGSSIMTSNVVGGIDGLSKLIKGFTAEISHSKGGNYKACLGCDTLKKIDLYSVLPLITNLRDNEDEIDVVFKTDRIKTYPKNSVSEPITQCADYPYIEDHHRRFGNHNLATKKFSSIPNGSALKYLSADNLVFLPSGSLNDFSGFTLLEVKGYSTVRYLPSVVNPFDLYRIVLGEKFLSGVYYDGTIYFDNFSDMSLALDIVQPDTIKRFFKIGKYSDGREILLPSQEPIATGLPISHAQGDKYYLVAVGLFLYKINLSDHSCQQVLAGTLEGLENKDLLVSQFQFNYPIVSGLKGGMDSDQIRNRNRDQKYARVDEPNLTYYKIDKPESKSEDNPYFQVVENNWVSLSTNISERYGVALPSHAVYFFPIIDEVGTVMRAAVTFTARSSKMEPVNPDPVYLERVSPTVQNFSSGFRLMSKTDEPTIEYLGDIDEKHVNWGVSNYHKFEFDISLWKPRNTKDFTGASWTAALLLYLSHAPNGTFFTGGWDGVNIADMDVTTQNAKIQAMGQWRRLPYMKNMPVVLMAANIIKNPDLKENVQAISNRFIFPGRLYLVPTAIIEVAIVSDQTGVVHFLNRLSNSQLTNTIVNSPNPDDLSKKVVLSEKFINDTRLAHDIFLRNEKLTISVKGEIKEHLGLPGIATHLLSYLPTVSNYVNAKSLNNHFEKNFSYFPIRFRNDSINTSPTVMNNFENVKKDYNALGRAVSMGVRMVMWNTIGDKCPEIYDLLNRDILKAEKEKFGGGILLIDGMTVIDYIRNYKSKNLDEFILYTKQAEVFYPDKDTVNNYRGKFVDALIQIDRRNTENQNIATNNNNAVYGMGNMPRQTITSGYNNVNPNINNNVNSGFVNNPYGNMKRSEVIGRVQANEGYIPPRVDEDLDESIV